MMRKQSSRLYSRTTCELLRALFGSIADSRMFSPEALTRSQSQISAIPAFRDTGGRHPLRFDRISHLSRFGNLRHTVVVTLCCKVTIYKVLSFEVSVTKPSMHILTFLFTLTTVLLSISSTLAFPTDNNLVSQLDTSNQTSVPYTVESVDAFCYGQPSSRRSSKYWKRLTDCEGAAKQLYTREVRWHTDTRYESLNPTTRSVHDRPLARTPRRYVHSESQPSNQIKIRSLTVAAL